MMLDNRIASGGSLWYYRYMGINVEVIPHQDQRYPTCGDWWISPEGTLLVRVSATPQDHRYEQLVAIHEIIEATLCHARGVDEEEVSAFDKTYEYAREGDELAQELLHDRWRCSCDITSTSEPGMDPHAPYHLEHVFATQNERMMADWMGVDWDTYEQALLDLDLAAIATPSAPHTSPTSHTSPAPHNTDRKETQPQDACTTDDPGHGLHALVHSSGPEPVRAPDWANRVAHPAGRPSVSGPDPVLAGATTHYTPQDAPPIPNYMTDTCPLACPVCGSRVLIDSACDRCGWDCPTC